MVGFQFINQIFMWVKQYHQPAMTGNGNHTYIFMVMTGGWFIVLTTLYPNFGDCLYHR